MKLWDKGVSLNKRIESYTVGDDYILDHVLIPYDCIASIAHAKMLGKIGILTKSEVSKLCTGLKEIKKLHGDGKFKITMSQEDCHTAIEVFLTKKYGDVGKKIHTARSRNDQVVTAIRLYSKHELLNTRKMISHVHDVILKFKMKYSTIPMPGFTHTRKAMPMSIALWCDSFLSALKDDFLLIDVAYRLNDQSPLGTAAGFGVPIKIDRKYTAKKLDFKRIQKNPLYAQNSRGKFESSILHALHQVMMDLNKIASDLIVFSMPEFGFFELPDDLCTGSSIMPQKKNPDVLELVRANASVVASLEFQLKQMTTNLISGYHRDFQLTKAPLIKGFQITQDTLGVTSVLFSKLTVNKEKCKTAMTDELFATESVYKLVESGMPFRDAYQLIAKGLK